MRKTQLPVVVVTFLLAAIAVAQQPQEKPPSESDLKTRTAVPGTSSAPAGSSKAPWIVPAGTRVPVQLKQAISTKNAQPGDTIYAQTTFPVVVSDQVMIPAGTFVQGVIDDVKRAGRIKGRAELGFHITTLMYPNGYVTGMVAAIRDVPGDETSQIKEPGTVAHDSEKGKDLERVGKDASEGAAIGSAAGVGIRPSFGGLRAGGLAGIAAGTMIGLLARGSDVRFEVGTVVDVVLNHAIAIDGEKIMRPATLPAYYPSPQGYPVAMPPPPRQ